MTDIVRYEPKQSSLELAPAAWKLAEKIANTEMVPKVLMGRPEAVLAVMLTGHEAGLSPMMSLQKIHIIEGRPAMAAELMRALVLQHGHEIYFEEMSRTSVTITGRRRGTERWTKVTWTLDDAKAAGLTGKQVWQKWPRSMLQARASAELCRAIFPDVLAGISYTLEELDDGAVSDQLIDFGPAEIAPPVPATTKAKATKAITRAGRSTDAEPKAPAPAGEIPDLPDSGPADEPDEAELEPVDEPVAEEVADDDIADAEIVDDTPPLPDEPPADEWPSGEWQSSDEMERTYSDEEVRRFTGPQQIAIQLAKRFGIKGNTAEAKAERLRAIVVLLQVDRVLTSSKDLTPDEIGIVLRRIADWPEGQPLFPADSGPAEAPPATPDAEIPDLPPPAAAAAPPATTATRPTRQAPAPHAPPETWDGEQWRDFLSKRKVKVAETMRQASKLGGERTPPVPIGTLDDIAGSGIAVDLVGWAEDLSLERRTS